MKQFTLSLIGLPAAPSRRQRLTDIDTEISKLLTRYNQDTLKRPLRDRKADGTAILSLLVDRYSISHKIWPSPADDIVTALKAQLRTRRGTSPLLQSGARLTSESNRITDFAHDWIRANAAALGVILLGLYRVENATELIAKALVKANYRAQRGSQSISGSAVDKWLTQALRNSSELGASARQAIVEICLPGVRARLWSPEDFGKQKTAAQLLEDLRNLVRVFRM